MDGDLGRFFGLRVTDLTRLPEVEHTSTILGDPAMGSLAAAFSSVPQFLVASHVNCDFCLCCWMGKVSSIVLITEELRPSVCLRVLHKKSISLNIRAAVAERLLQPSKN
jgi:hypothetical protein